MGKTMKVWLWVAASLVLIGCIIWGGVMSVLKWDYESLSTVKYETNHYEIQEDYQNITVVTDTADITFAPSENGKHAVVCHEQKNAKHSVWVQDSRLVIEIVDVRKWYEHISILFDTPKITVYLPQGEYGDLSIKSSTGDITIPKDFTFENIDISESTGDVTVFSSVAEAMKINTTTGDITVQNISTGVLELSVSTGRVTVSDVNCEGVISVNVSTGKAKITNANCQNLLSSGDTGDISLQNAIAKEKLFIERTTGDITLDACDALQIRIQTDTGDVKGTLRTEKIFLVETDTGKIDIPHSTSGGKCEISTDTGDIRIRISH